MQLISDAQSANPATSCGVTWWQRRKSLERSEEKEDLILKSAMYECRKHIQACRIKSEPTHPLWCFRYGLFGYVLHQNHLWIERFQLPCRVIRYKALCLRERPRCKWIWTPRVERLPRLMSRLSPRTVRQRGTCVVNRNPSALM